MVSAFHERLRVSNKDVQLYIDSSGSLSFELTLLADGHVLIATVLSCFRDH